MKYNITFRNAFLIGILMAKIEYWSTKYEISFQFWNVDGEANNVFINKDDIEIASFGGEDTVQAILERAIEWLEKVNPKFEYPKGIMATCPEQ